MSFANQFSKCFISDNEILRPCCACLKICETYFFAKNMYNIGYNHFSLRLEKSILIVYLFTNYCRYTFIHLLFSNVTQQ